jgi:hypothetical protein
MSERRTSIVNLAGLVFTSRQTSVVNKRLKSNDASVLFPNLNCRVPKQYKLLHRYIGATNKATENYHQNSDGLLHMEFWNPRPYPTQLNPNSENKVKIPIFHNAAVALRNASRTYLDVDVTAVAQQHFDTPDFLLTD